MVARFIAQVFAVGASVVGRAFFQAWKQAGQKAAQQGIKQTMSGGKAHKLTIDEAQKILSVQRPFKMEGIMGRYNHLLKANDPNKGGSFYLQSKVVRAKERLEQAIKSSE